MNNGKFLVDFSHPGDYKKTVLNYVEEFSFENL
jgi:hypothetical protein